MFHLDTLSTLVAATLVLLLAENSYKPFPSLRNTLFLNPLPAVCWWRWRCWR